MNAEQHLSPEDERAAVDMAEAMAVSTQLEEAKRTGAAAEQIEALDARHRRAWAAFIDWQERAKAQALGDAAAYGARWDRVHLRAAQLSGSHWVPGVDGAPLHSPKH